MSAIKAQSNRVYKKKRSENTNDYDNRNKKNNNRLFMYIVIGIVSLFVIMISVVIKYNKFFNITVNINHISCLYSILNVINAT